MYKRACFISFLFFLFFSAASAQRAEVTVSLNEAFFDALLDSAFQNFDPPEFSIAQNRLNRRDAETQRKNNIGLSGFSSSFVNSSASLRLSGKNPVCQETIKILREVDGVRTAVRFREGKIFVPLAFSGNYAPPFVGCVEFAGWAETNIELEFDQAGQRLIGRARVLNVHLNGTGGVGGTMIAKLLQSSIDKKLNPIEIIRLDKLSFGVPVQNGGNLRMRAATVRPEIGGGVLNIRVTYDFLKG